MPTFLLCIVSLHSYLSMLFCIFSSLFFNFPCRHLLLPQGGSWISPFYHTGGISGFLHLQALDICVWKCQSFCTFLWCIQHLRVLCLPTLAFIHTHTKEGVEIRTIPTHLIVHRNLHIKHTWLLQWSVRLCRASLSYEHTFPLRSCKSHVDVGHKGLRTDFH